MQLRAEFFWRDPYKNEVDIIIDNKKPLPVEIKYGKTEAKGILAFMRKFKVDEGIIISKDKEEKQKSNKKIISVVPAYKYLLKV